MARVPAFMDNDLAARGLWRTMFLRSTSFSPVFEAVDPFEALFEKDDPEAPVALAPPTFEAPPEPVKDRSPSVVSVESESETAAEPKVVAKVPEAPETPTNTTQATPEQFPTAANVAKFGAKVRAILRDPANSGTLAFDAESQVLVILNQQRLVDVVLPNFFSATNVFKTFHRQLNHHGFKVQRIHAFGPGQCRNQV